VDFLHHTILMIIHARLLIYITTREIGYTYKLDRTTVTVGVLSMLATSKIPASVVASSSTWAPSGTVTLVEGAGLILLSVVPPTVSQVSSCTWSTGSDG
jgi:hypothetical protein